MKDEGVKVNQEGTRFRHSFKYEMNVTVTLR